MKTAFYQRLSRSETDIGSEQDDHNAMPAKMRPAAMALSLPAMPQEANALSLICGSTMPFAIV